MTLALVQAVASDTGSATIAAPSHTLICLQITASGTPSAAPSSTGATWTSIASGGATNNTWSIYVATVFGTGTTVSQGTPTGGMVVLEFSGTPALTAVSDGSNQTKSTTSPITTSGFTTTVADELLIGWAAAFHASSNVTWTAAGAPWTQAVNTAVSGSHWSQYLAWQELAATGSQTYSQTFTNTASVTVSTICVAVKALVPAKSLVLTNRVARNALLRR